MRFLSEQKFGDALNQKVKMLYLTNQVEKLNFGFSRADSMALIN